VAILSGARAQACVPFRGSPGTAHKCDTFLVPGTNVFLAPNQTYESVDAAAGNSTHLFGAFMPPDCRTAGLRLLCLSSFLPCDFSSTGLAGSSPPLFIRFLSLFASFCFFCSAPARSRMVMMVMGCSVAAVPVGVRGDDAGVLRLPGEPEPA
jgi:hypothetical protein